MKNKIQQVICKSGITGYQCHLQDLYNDADQFCYYDEAFGLHQRLGYRDRITCWQANPTIQGSVIPGDFRKVS